MRWCRSPPFHFRQITATQRCLRSFGALTQFGIHASMILSAPPGQLVDCNCATALKQCRQRKRACVRSAGHLWSQTAKDRMATGKRRLGRAIYSGDRPAGQVGQSAHVSRQSRPLRSSPAFELAEKTRLAFSSVYVSQSMCAERCAQHAQRSRSPDT